MKLDTELIKLINLFEEVTKAKVKDCFENNERLVFVVKDVDVLRAIGKNAANIKKVENMLKKRIKIVGYSEEITKFVRSFIAPLKADSIEFVDGIVYIKSIDTRVKGLLIGRNKKNLNNLIEVAKKYYEFEDIRVE